MGLPGEDLRKLFLDRTHSRALFVEARDRAEGSRIGGAPPAALGESPRPCPVCGKNLLYVSTLEADLLGEAIAQGRAASLLVCGDSCILRDPLIGEGHASVAFVHEPSPRGPAVDWQWAPEGRGLSALPPAPDPSPAKYSKIGGRPGLVQDDGERIDEAFGFLFQLADDFGVTECRARVFLLGGSGSFYVFGRIENGAPTLEELRGFNQI